jgi:hypothetical protein
MPTVVAASQVHSGSDTAEHAHSPMQVIPISPPSETQAAQHVASRGHTLPHNVLPPRPPSADPEATMRGNGVARANSPTAHANARVTRSNSMTAANIRPSTPSRHTSSPSLAAHAALRSETLRSDVAADFVQQRSPGQHALGQRRQTRSPTDSGSLLSRDRSLSFRTTGGVHVQVPPSTPADTAVCLEPQLKHAQDRGYQGHVSEGANDQELHDAEMIQSPTRQREDRGSPYARPRNPGAPKGVVEPTSTMSSSACYLNSLYRTP